VLAGGIPKEYAYGIIGNIKWFEVRFNFALDA